MKRIVFIFKDDGSVEVDAEGFQGSECVDLTDRLLKPLDPKLESRKIKGEYYVKAKTQARAGIQG
ncbi:MAG: DUF2997 domain-containing protein [Candidatus Bathyarchaeota archaeon]|nr:DUF2997 domain-containing protein [Candidatus Bathyarchaeota archaeon]MDW8022346.1 DUF2997 domain-containing protein [Nitrososphaerota archaeon]